MILKCNCNNEFQDQKYGRGMRVHNMCRKTEKIPQMYRCTVCKNKRVE